MSRVPPMDPKDRRIWVPVQVVLFLLIVWFVFPGPNLHFNWPVTFLIYAGIYLVIAVLIRFGLARRDGPKAP
jgi:hypothetical protein